MVALVGEVVLGERPARGLLGETRVGDILEEERIRLWGGKRVFQMATAEDLNAGMLFLVM